ncbi:MAG: hypothetical protein AB2L14_26165 [Candidatus Xenobiia bacterium LiM19]
MLIYYLQALHTVCTDSSHSPGWSWQETGSLGFGSPQEPNCYIAKALDNIGTPYVFCIGTDGSLHLYKYAVSKEGGDCVKGGRGPGRRRIGGSVKPAALLVTGLLVIYMADSFK